MTVLTSQQGSVRSVQALRFGALLLATLLLLLVTLQAHSQLVTRVPVSADSGTSIADSLFPLTITLEHGKLFLKDPSLLFLDKERLAMEVSFQAYEHRPEAGVALSETGSARLSGKLDYDPATRQVLLHGARMEKLEFDRDNAASEKFAGQIRAAWLSQFSDPLRSDLPPHPYIMPFRENIDNISYDGKNIYISLVYR